MATNQNTSGKSNINDILSIGNELLKRNNKNSKKGIYKNELFSNCESIEEKRNIRNSLRKKLSFFVSSMFEYEKTNNKEKAQQLAKSFNEYANKVYNNINVLYENNTNELSIKNIDQFRLLVEKYTNTITQQKLIEQINKGK